MKCQIMLNRFCMTLAESWHVDRPAIPPIVSNIKSKSYLNLLQECHMESHQLKLWSQLIFPSGYPSALLESGAQGTTDLILISLVSVHMLKLVGFPSRALGSFSPWKEPHLLPPHGRGAQGSTELLQLLLGKISSPPSPWLIEKLKVGCGKQISAP